MIAHIFYVNKCSQHPFPNLTLLELQCSSILNNWLYFAILSVLHNDPVLICPEETATDKSDIILSFLLEAKEHECFKKYTKYEYAFSDFILDFDYENKAISRYPLYKDRISDFDKHIYEERYKNYLMEKVNSFWKRRLYLK